MSTIQTLNVIKKKHNFYMDMCTFCGVIININFFVFVNDSSKSLAAFGIGIVFVIIFATRASKYDKMLRTQYKSVFVKNILSESLEDVHYDWNRGFTGPEIYALQLFHYGGHVSDNYLKASCKGIRFEQANVIHRDHGSNRFSFRGKVMIINNPFVNLEGIWVYTKKFSSYSLYAKKTQKYVLIQDNEFAEIFDIYITGEKDINHIFTAEIKQRLLLLAKKYKSFGLCFKGRKLNIAIGTPRKAFEIGDYSKEIIYDVEVERIRQDVADIAEVIEILGNIKNESY